MANQLDDRRRRRHLERYQANQLLLQEPVKLLLHLWGPGELVGDGEWVSSTPRPEHGQRLVVNLSYGSWRLDGDAGDTLVALVQRLCAHPSEREALSWVAAWAKTHSLTAASAPASSKKAVVIAQPPPPDKLLDLAAADGTLWVRAGMPSAHVKVAHWEYRNLDGTLMFYVARFQRVDGTGKLYRKLAYFGPAEGWRLETKVYQVPTPWPLYNLPELAARPTDPVLVVEGEKAADAARALLPSYVVTCWPGGDKAVSHVDFSPLRDRHVTCWPDNDAVGLAAMAAVTGVLMRGLTADVETVPVNKLKNVTLPLGWDLADPPPPGLDAFTVAKGAHDLPDWLLELNARHFVALEGGKARVFKEVTNPITRREDVVRLTAPDFCLLEDNKRVLSVDPRGNPIYVGRGSYWLEHPKRREYAMTVFIPAGEVPAAAYNLWRGYGCGRRPGLPKRVLRFIYTVICRKRKEEFLYVVRWLARLVQEPHRPAETALVLRGLKGIGKGFFASMTGSLIPQHFVPLSNQDHVSGRFNGHMRQAVLLFADEAFYAGDRKHESVLKTLITERLLSYEHKGLDIAVDYNRVHLIMASNSDWVVPASLDERRFCVLDVSSAHRKDYSYFEGLEDALDDGEREQLLNMLLTVNLRGWWPQDVPQNEELGAQKLQSLEPHLAFLVERLVGGHWLVEQSFDNVYNAYVAYCERVGERRRKNAIHLGRALSDMWGDLYSTKLRSVGGEKLRFVHLPHENKARWFLAQKHGLVELTRRDEDDDSDPGPELPY